MPVTNGPQIALRANIGAEAGLGSSTNVNLNNASIRSLIGKGAGAQNAMSEYYGASSGASVVSWAAVVNIAADKSFYTGATQNLDIQSGDLLVMCYTARGGNSGNNNGSFKMFSGPDAAGVQTTIPATTAIKEHGGTVSGVMYATASGSFDSMQAHISAGSSFNGMALWAGVFRNVGTNTRQGWTAGGNGGTNQSIFLSGLTPPGVIIAVGGRSTTSSRTVTFTNLTSIAIPNGDAGGTSGYNLSNGTTYGSSCDYAWSYSVAHFT